MHGLGKLHNIYGFLQNYSTVLDSIPSTCFYFNLVLIFARDIPGHGNEVIRLYSRTSAVTGNR